MTKIEELLQEAETFRSAIQDHGSIRAASRELGVPESTMRGRLNRASEVMLGTALSINTVYRWPREDRNRYFLLSSAQDATRVDHSFMNSLEAYADWLGDCEIILSGFTYSKTLFEDHDTRSPKVFFDKRIAHYIQHDRIRIGAPGSEVDFCAEMNTLPTATRPLSGLYTYTQKRWGIFPHPNVQLESLPTMKDERSKQVMTTGCVTVANAIRKKAGIKGMFHHTIGAVIVELCPDGTFFVRHISAPTGGDGSFQDMDRIVTADGVTEGNRVEALTYGDIHYEKLDPVVARATWGYCTESQTKSPSYPCLADTLHPKYEFYHDLSDFTPRNHHNITDHHFRFQRHMEGPEGDNVELALQGPAIFLSAISHPDRKQKVVISNHDQALVRWLKTADYKTDPENAVFFLRSQTWFYEQLAEGVSSPAVFEYVLRGAGVPEETEFLDEDSSFLLCGDIENAMHGHLGVNGARAAPGSFVRGGAKSTTGHTHSPRIFDGGIVSGVSGTLDQGYNKGMSSWAQAHVATYPNGKRAILTMQNGRFFAGDIDHRNPEQGELPCFT